MLPDRVSNPGPLTYESGALPIALRGPATVISSCSDKLLIFRVCGIIAFCLSGQQLLMKHVYEIICI